MSAEDLPFDAKSPEPRRCPICGKAAVPDVSPFCSKRCADVDLHRWLQGVYVVPDDDPGQPEAPLEAPDE